VTAGRLWALLARVDLGHAKELLDHLSLPLLAAGATALLATSPFSALRWHVVSSGRDNLSRTLDVAQDRARRVVFLTKFCSGVGTAIRSLVLDRVSGHFVTVALLAASLPVLLHILPDACQRYGVVLLLGAAPCGLFGLFLIDYLPWRLLRLRLVAELAALSRGGRRMFAQPERLATLLGLAIATVGLTILAFMPVADSLGVDLSFGSWVVIVPPVSLIQLVPVSLAGWGVRELGVVVVLAGFGIPAEAALANSLLVGLCLIVVGLPGGLLWLTGRDITSATLVKSGRVAARTDP
jgi:hypothetical protein